MHFTFANKVVVVTGAASNGIGRAVALAFAEAGAKTAIWDVRDLEHTSGMLAETGADFLAQHVDVSDAKQVATAMDKVERYLGPVNILVNNAGMVIRKPLLEITETEWDLVQSVNLKGYFLCSKEAARRMTASGIKGALSTSVRLLRFIRYPSRYIMRRPREAFPRSL